MYHPPCLLLASLFCANSSLFPPSSSVYLSILSVLPLAICIPRMALERSYSFIFILYFPFSLIQVCHSICPPPPSPFSVSTTSCQMSTPVSYSSSLLRFAQPLSVFLPFPLSIHFCCHQPSLSVSLRSPPAPPHPPCSFFYISSGFNPKQTNLIFPLFSVFFSLRLLIIFEFHPSHRLSPHIFSFTNPLVPQHSHSISVHLCLYWSVCLYLPLPLFNRHCHYNTSKRLSL